MLVFSSVVTQQIIPDKIQFVLSVPCIVISVLVSFVVKRRVSSCFHVELYLTTVALGATLQNLIVQIYNTLSFHVLMTEHVWSSGQVQFVSFIAPKQFQHSWSDGRCKGCCISTQNVQSDLMHWQQRGKTSPYKGNLHSAVLIGAVCAFTEPENAAKYHSTKPVPLIKCLFIQLQLKHELCFNSTA